MIWGAVLGGLLSILLLLRYFTGTFLSSSLLLGFLERLIQIVGLYMVVVKFPFAPEKRRWLNLFGYGTLVMIFAAVLTSFTTYMLYTFDPELMKQSIELAMEGLEALKPYSGQTAEYEEAFSGMNPFILFFSNLLSASFMGILLSAGVSAFCMLSLLVRRNNHFR